MAGSSVRTRAEALAADIEAEIVEKGLAPGDSFGTLDTIRTKSGFARSTVSEAVRLLNDRGVLDIRPGRGGGLFVAASNPVVRLRHMLLRVREQPTPVADAIAVREALEGLVNVEAARHCSETDKDDLRSALQTLVRAGDDTDYWMRANWALHERIAEITPNHLLKATYLGTTRYITEASERVETDAEVARDAAYFRRRLDIHIELVDAIIDGDEARTLRAAAEHNATI